MAKEKDPSRKARVAVIFALVVVGLFVLSQFLVLLR